MRRIFGVAMVVLFGVGGATLPAQRGRGRISCVCGPRGAALHRARERDAAGPARCADANRVRPSRGRAGGGPRRGTRRRADCHAHQAVPVK